MSGFRDASKEELDAFIVAYPRPLVKDVSGIWEPPVMAYNDFTKGNWPDSIVATVVLYESYPKDGKAPYKWAPNTHRVWVDDGA